MELLNQGLMHCVSRAGVERLTDEEIKAMYRLTDAEFIKVKNRLEEFNKLGEKEFYKKYGSMYDLYQR